MSPNSILSYLLERTLWISLAILFLLLIRPLMKHLPRIGLYVLWIIVVVRILCPVDFAGLYRLFPDARETASLFQDHVAYGGMENHYRLSPEQKAWLAPERSDAPKQVQPIERVQQNSAETIQATAVQDALPFAFIGSYLTHSPFLCYGVLLLWGLGVLLCLGHLIRSLRKDRRVLCNATFIGDRIYLHPLLETSFVTGFIRPRIYLPTRLSDTDRAYLLAHEQVHIRRHDFQLKPIAYLAFSLLWFNPLGWLAWHLMLKDMEISCDEAVIRRLGTDQRKYYSHLLLTMASGQKRILNTNTAFGADIIQERILHVMKYKNPTKFLIAMTLVISLLCACGVASSPTEPTNAPRQGGSDATEDAVYVEQALTLPKAEDGEHIYYFSRFILNHNKELVWLGQQYDRKTTTLLSYVKAVYTDTGWTTEEAGWSQTILNNFANSHGYLAEAWYTSDGTLYAVFSETSIEIMKYRQNGEKYADQFKITGQHLFRIDEQKNTVKEIDIPDAGGDHTRYAGINFYVPFPNGNYLVTNVPNNRDDARIYSGVTDEVIDRPEKAIGKNAASLIIGGDDFLCYPIYNVEKKVIQIQVCDIDGNNAYVMDYEAPAENGITTAGMPFTLGVCENEMILVSKEGIYHAEYGDKEFTKTSEPETENIYYLSLDRYQFMEFNLWVAGRDDFYTMMIDSSASGGNDYKLCHYFKK